MEQAHRHADGRMDSTAGSEQSVPEKKTGKKEKRKERQKKRVLLFRVSLQATNTVFCVLGRDLLS